MELFILFNAVVAVDTYCACTSFSMDDQTNYEVEGVSGISIYILLYQNISHFVGCVFYVLLCEFVMTVWRLCKANLNLGSVSLEGPFSTYQLSPA